MSAKNEYIDEHGQNRDKRGEWRSGRLIVNNPLFSWPFRPVAFLQWLWGYIFPWNVTYVAITAVVYFYFTPDISRMATFKVDWVLEIFVRNVVLITIFATLFQFWHYTIKGQGRKKKYNGNWLAKDNSLFLFSNQLYDNIFWTIVSGVTIWSAYEVGMWWAYANNYLPYINFESNPIWFALWVLLVPIWRLAHFYFIHRLIHWKPLYDWVHYLHHKNVNVGPWSGMAMHPVEHLLYFSCMLIHIVIPSHPFHMLFNGLQTGLQPMQSHTGFDEIVLTDGISIDNESLHHYLHHRYHNVNFGSEWIPLDAIFGSFHDGSEEANEHFRRLHQKRNS